MVKIADINNQNTLAQSFLEKKIIEMINRNVDGIALVVTVVVGNIIGGIVLVGNKMLTVGILMFGIAIIVAIVKMGIVLGFSIQYYTWNCSRY